jgi:CRISPR-associated endoribonuclease Cas6
MLTSLVITVTATEQQNIPSNLGRANQKLFFSLIDQHNPELAQRLHDLGGPKPFTVSNLMMGQTEQPGRRVVKAGQSGWLRFTGLTEEVSETLLTAAKEMPATVEIDHQILKVTGVTFNPAEHAWAGVVSYQDFAASYLLAEDVGPKRRYMTFVGPTTFRHNKIFRPLPQPELVYGSLLDRWQQVAPIALHPAMRAFATEMIGIQNHRVKSLGIPTKGRGQIIAFTGQVTYHLQHSDRYWRAMFNLLTDFAFFGGVGYQTTAGLGMVKSIEN